MGAAPLHDSGHRIASRMEDAAEEAESATMRPTNLIPCASPSQRGQSKCETTDSERRRRRASRSVRTDSCRQRSWTVEQSSKGPFGPNR